MKVKFNGVLETKVSGCKPCGTRRVSERVMATKKTYILPSGTSQTFYAGCVTEVSEENGKFLLSYPNAFTEVE